MKDTNTPRGLAHFFHECGPACPPYQSEVTSVHIPANLAALFERIGSTTTNPLTALYHDRHISGMTALELTPLWEAWVLQKKTRIADEIYQAKMDLAQALQDGDY